MSSKLHYVVEYDYNKFTDVSNFLHEEDLVSDLSDDDVYTDTYIASAFRSSQSNQVYLFMNFKYLLLDYEHDKIVSGPNLICDVGHYKSLRPTVFEEYGVSCAFPSALKVGEAYIFGLNDCAVINYIDHSIMKGPMDITEMFPFLKQTQFEIGYLDAAFDSKKDEPEAYIFKGKSYALINYGPQGKVIDHGLITQRFPSLIGTIFENGIDAAFASHKDNEAYIFKDDSCALIQFPTATSKDDGIIEDVTKILSKWPSLQCILPGRNCRPLLIYKDGPYLVADTDSDSDSGVEPVSMEQQDKKKVKRSHGKN